MSSLASSQDYNNGLICFLEDDYVCARVNFSEVIDNESNFNATAVEYSHY